MRVLASYSAFGAFANRPALDLAERLCALAPMDDARVFLGSGGGDAIDVIKLARRHFAAVGQPDYVHLIGRTQGYHGTHGLGTSIGGIPANRDDAWGRWTRTPRWSRTALEALEAETGVGPDRVAAVFVEPVMGARGVHQPRPGYVEGGGAVRARRRAPRPRRGDRRLRPAGNLVRRRPLRRAAGLDLLREGRDERLPAARRGPRVGPGRAVLGRGGTMFRHEADVQRPPDLLRRGAWPAWRSSSARACWAAGASSRTRSRPSCAPWASTSWPARSARAWVRLGPWRSRPRRCASGRTLCEVLRPRPRPRALLIRPLGDAVAISPPPIATREQIAQAAAAMSEAHRSGGPSGLRAGRRGRRRPA